MKYGILYISPKNIWALNLWRKYGIVFTCIGNSDFPIEIGNSLYIFYESLGADFTPYRDF